MNASPHKCGIRGIETLEKSGLGAVLNSYPLASGANNEIMMLEFEDYKAVLKMTKENGVRRLKNESLVLSVVGDAIGPKVLWKHLSNDADDQDFLVVEYIAGEHKYRLSDDEAAQLGTALKTIHGTDVTDLAGIVESPSWKEYFHQRLMSQYLNVKGIAPSAQVDEIKSHLDKIYEFGSSIENKLSIRDAVLVHADIIPLNVIYENGKCRLIDWELARLDFPEWDICSVFKVFDFQGHSKDAFAEAYQKKIDEDRYLLISLLHYSNVALWRLHSFYCNGENADIKDKFLMELDAEIEWVKNSLP